MSLPPKLSNGHLFLTKMLQGTDYQHAVKHAYAPPEDVLAYLEWVLEVAGKARDKAKRAVETQAQRAAERAGTQKPGGPETTG